MKVNQNTVAITGIGVVTPIGTGKNAFLNAMKNDATNFSVSEFQHGGVSFNYPIAKTEGFDMKKTISELGFDGAVPDKAKRLRHISLSTSYGICCSLEAWNDAGLTNAELNPNRIAIVSSGSNTQLATILGIQNEYKDKISFLNPNYGLNFFDSDIVGVLSELLSIKGEGYSVGAASASGNMSIIHGARLIASDEYDVVVVVAPLMDLSIFEFQGFTALGAMAKLSAQLSAGELCRPFDISHSGFVYGQSAGCLILESEEHALKRKKKNYATIVGYGVNMDSNRNPNPSVAGEHKAMQSAIRNAGLPPEAIDYVNTHGSSSSIGDVTEAEAILLAGLNGVKANSTKSLIGHSLSAAGVVECVATLIQMENSFLHNNHNLIESVNNKIDFVQGKPQPFEINFALSNSFGFGGINTSILLKNNPILKN